MVPEAAYRPDDDDWHEERRNAERCYLGTLLNWRPGQGQAGVKVKEGDLAFDLHKVLLRQLRDEFPWDDVLTVLGNLRGGPASTRYSRQQIVDVLAASMELGLPFTQIDQAALAVLYHSKRAERAKLIDRMRGYAHDPDTLKDLCGKLMEV